jgi:hypothetical protein
MVLLLRSCLFVQAINLTDSNSTLEAALTLSEYSQRKAWPYLSQSRAIGIRTQRDISANISVGYNIAPGVDLTSVVFEPFGYNTTSLDIFTSLLQVGVQSYVLDLYYNENSKNWLLCSKDKILSQQLNILRNSSTSNECLSGAFGIQQLIDQLNTFILATNNDLNVNFVFLLLKLNSFSLNTNVTVSSSLTTSNVQSLTSVFQGINSLVPPYSINTEDLPTIHTLLFKQRMRVFPIIIEDNLPTNSTYNLVNDNLILFGSSTLSDLLNSQIYDNFDILNLRYDSLEDLNCEMADVFPNSSYFSFSYDTFNNSYSLRTFVETIRCGYSPILNHRFNNIEDISKFLEVSLWSWSPFQPTVTGLDQTLYPNLLQNSNIDNILDYYDNMNFTIGNQDIYMKNNTNNESSHIPDPNDNDGGDNDNEGYLDRCAVVTRLGWISTACDKKLHPICQNNENTLSYYVLEDTINFVKANIACKNYNSKYTLASPRTVFEQNNLISFLNDSSHYYWINLNSLSTENCWVVGLNSNCPYQKVVSRHIFIQMITPASIMTFLLGVLLIYLQLRGLPVHKNRRYWKKLLNEKLKNDYNGIPS